MKNPFLKELLNLWESTFDTPQLPESSGKTHQWKRFVESDSVNIVDVKSQQYSKDRMDTWNRGVREALQGEDQVTDKVVEEENRKKKMTKESNLENLEK